MRIWVASIIFYTTIYVFCEILRFIVRKRLINIPAQYVGFVNEFIGVVQVCAPMFDVNVVLEHYGLQGVLIEITFIELVNAFVLRDALADPCPLIVDFMKKRVAIQELLITIAVQFSGAYFSYLLVLAFWKIGVHSEHLHLLEKDCESDLTVTLLYGSLVEAGGCLLSKFAEHFMESRVSEQILRFSGALLSGIITVFGIHLTGMYANPLVAWACTFNCGEIPHLTHFVVYWVAPLVAWNVADRLLHSEGEEKETKVE
ncbi:Aquaporin [Aphelenchoides bicaudatus]|nr:Aquaporin [Aphelenchoides bicaudatus]